MAIQSLPDPNGQPVPNADAWLIDDNELVAIAEAHGLVVPTVNRGLNLCRRIGIVYPLTDRTIEQSRENLGQYPVYFYEEELLEEERQIVPQLPTPAFYNGLQSNYGMPAYMQPSFHRLRSKSTLDVLSLFAIASNGAISEYRRSGIGTARTLVSLCNLIGVEEQKSA